jgi:hypothetical protein
MCFIEDFEITEFDDVRIACRGGNGLVLGVKRAHGAGRVYSHKPKCRQRVSGFLARKRAIVIGVNCRRVPEIVKLRRVLVREQLLGALILIRDRRCEFRRNK